MYDQAIPLYRWDALLKVNLYRGQAIRVYGVPICAVEVRQAGKREVRQVLSSYPRTNVVH
jgi:hypothetical protein